MKINRAISILMLGTILAANCSTRAWAATNLLTNGDFETGTSAGWTGIPAGSVNATGAHAGNYGMHLTAAADVNQGWITVTPGKTYVLMCWFKWDAFAKTGSDWGYDRFVVGNNQWQTLGTINNLHSLYQQGVWNKLAITFVADTNGVQVDAGTYGPVTTVDLSFDDFVLMEKTSNLAPTLNPTASVTSGNAPLAVNFTANADDADGAVANYFWDFGDGTSDIIANPSHTYTAKGTYAATLTVWDNDGAQSSKSISINVLTDSLPDVSITNPTSQSSYSTSATQLAVGGTATAPSGRQIVFVSWDNINTDIAGIVSISTAASVNWLTNNINLKPGKNEILITAVDNQGYAGTKTLIVNRTVSGPSVSNISMTPTSGRMYEKVEVKFDLQTTAEYPLYRYDTATPTGIKPGVGVTAEGVITTPSGKTIRQPAFWYRDPIRSGSYPTATYLEAATEHWMVRFSPQEIGSYAVSIHVQDASGVTDVGAGSFSASAPVKKGYVKVSAADPRYFEFTDGSLYWPIGPADAGATDPTTGQSYSRIWLGGEGIYSTNWSRWHDMIDQWGNEGAVPPLYFREHYPAHELSRRIWYPENFTIWTGDWSDDAYHAKFKANTNYLVKLRVKTANIAGPADSSRPYGVVIKEGGLGAFGDAVSQLPSFSSKPSWIPIINRSRDWHTVVAVYRMPADASYVSIFLDNVTAGSAYIDEFSVREIMADGSLGGEQIRQPKSDMHTYAEQRPAAHVDDQVAYFEQVGIEVQYIVQDKNDWIPFHIARNGAWADAGDGYYQPDGTKVRWLQQQWWRYLAARWGYSTALRGWELNNEGPPDDGTGTHAQATQDMGRYFHQIDIHRHLTSTSFWCCWEPTFWSNKSSFPDVDYGDIHTYTANAADGADMAAWHLKDATPVYQSAVGKPVIRGETGISGDQTQFDLLKNTSNPGYWYHDLLWCELYPGSMFDPNYWYSEHFAMITGGKGAVSKPFYQFMQGLDLNKGGYVDAAAGTTNTNIRVVGQKNLPKGQAHLWIQNKNHTWLNAMQNPGAIGTQSGTVTVRMSPSTSYNLEWWNTYTGTKSNQTLTSNSLGDLALTISNLADDTAVKITPTSQIPVNPPASPRTFRLR